MIKYVKEKEKTTNEERRKTYKHQEQRPLELVSC